MTPDNSSTLWPRFYTHFGHLEFRDKIGVWDKFDVNLLHKKQIGWKAMRIYQGFGINLTDLKSRSWCTYSNIFWLVETNNGQTNCEYWILIHLKIVIYRQTFFVKQWFSLFCQIFKKWCILRNPFLLITLPKMSLLHSSLDFGDILGWAK